MILKRKSRENFDDFFEIFLENVWKYFLQTCLESPFTLLHMILHQLEFFKISKHFTAQTKYYSKSKKNTNYAFETKKNKNEFLTN